MPIEITMPALSPTMEEGKLAKWHIKEGDVVESGDILADIETDKATMEFESIESGIVAKILVPEGTKGVKVNQLIAYLVEEGEAFDEKALNASATTIAPTETLTVQSSPKESVMPLSGQSSSIASGQNAGASQEAFLSTGDIIFSSPLARRLAKQAGVNLTNIKGSGPRGRIIKRDIEAYLENPAAFNLETSSNQGIMQRADKSILQLYDEKSYEIIPHSSIRKIIATRLVESKQVAPHFYVSMDCELDELLSLRQKLNLDLENRYGKESCDAYKLSVNDMIIKAIALAFQRMPEANVTWLESGMLKHKHVDISVAVSTENGLVTPILRHAEEKTLFDLAKEAKDLIIRARANKLKPEEYQGGTTSISNMGMFGVKSFSAILNPPQATIFAIGMAEKIPLIKENAISIGTNLTITLSVDHRAIDGVLAAELLQWVKKIIENPLLLLQ